MKSIYIIVALIIISIFSVIFFIYWSGRTTNFVNNNLFFPSVGWRENVSEYAGSEFSFNFKNSKTVEFEFSSNSKAEQAIEILIDDKLYWIYSPNFDSQKLTVFVDRNVAHNVTTRHHCNHTNYPCKILIKGVFLENGAKLTPYQHHNKLISVLGDSVSSIYSMNNYTNLLAIDLGYELRNASVTGSTVSKIPGFDNAINRYKKDILKYKSDIILIFIGSNDIAQNVSPETFNKDYETIVKDVKTFNPEGKIFLVGILPRADILTENINLFNSLIENLAKKYNATYINTTGLLSESDFHDGVHPSLESQKKISLFLKETIASQIK